MDKIGVRHEDNLTFHRQDTKTQSFEKLTKMTAAALTHTWQKNVSRPPSTRPSPQGEGESSTVSLKNLRLD
jgi:hypothetical protein